MRYIGYQMICKKTNMCVTHTDHFWHHTQSVAGFNSSRVRPFWPLLSRGLVHTRIWLTSFTPNRQTQSLFKPNETDLVRQPCQIYPVIGNHYSKPLSWWWIQGQMLKLLPSLSIVQVSIRFYKAAFWFNFDLTAVL